MEETFGHIPVQYVHLPARNRSGSSASPIKMGYRVIGEGAQKILFIMGFRSSHLAWAYQAQYFAARPEYQLCVFDNRGCGFTDSPYGRYTTSMLAEDAYTLVQGTLGWEKFHLVGVSMGGMISLELASRYPQHIISLSLLVTHAGGFRSRIPLSGIANITHERHKEEEHENLSRRLSMIYTKEVSLLTMRLTMILLTHHRGCLPF